jgi:predicted O-methyltransferase YrrM
VTWQEVAKEAKGFLGPNDGPMLREQALAVAHLGLPMVEIGAYCGKSACWLGSACAEHGLTLFSVDTHRGTNSPECQPGRECHDPDIMDDEGVYDTLRFFRRTMRAAGLEDAVVPVVGRSHTVGKLWQTPLSLLFIDGGHDETVLGDWEHWGKWVQPGGRVLFHDYKIPVIGEAVRMARRAGLRDVLEVGDTMFVLEVPR